MDIMLEGFYCVAWIDPKLAKKLLSAANKLELKVSTGQTDVSSRFSSTSRAFSTCSVLRMAINFIY